MEEVEIRIRGQINASWSDWLGGLKVTPTEEGGTILSGSMRDQSALLGVLNKLSGMGLEISSVNSGKGKERSANKDVQPTGH